MRPFLRTAVIAAAAAWVTFTARGGTAQVVAVDTLDSGVVSINYSQAGAKKRLALEIVQQLGSLDDEGPSLFGDIRGIEVDTHGRLVILEHQASEIRRFNPDGSFDAYMARKGSGPREIRSANGIHLTDGGDLWVNDHGNNRITRLGADGEVSSYPLFVPGYGYLWNGGVSVDGRIWTGWMSAAGMDRRPEPGVASTVARHHYKSLEPTTGRLDSLLLGTSNSTWIALPRGSVGVPFAPSFLYALDPTGFVWTASSDQYVVTKSTLDGDTVLIVSVETEAPRVESDERSEAVAGVESFMERAGRVSIDWDDVIPEEKPILQRLIVDDDSRLWVQRDTGARVVFDVFDADGVIQQTLEPTFKVDRYLIAVVRRGAYYTVVLDEMDVPYVIRAESASP